MTKTNLQELWPKYKSKVTGAIVGFAVLLLGVGAGAWATPTAQQLVVAPAPGISCGTLTPGTDIYTFTCTLVGLGPFASPSPSASPSASPSSSPSPSPSASASPTTSPSVSPSPSPSPTPSPTGGNNCRLDPGRCGFPNAANTGVPPGTALTQVNGNVTLSTAGMVYEGKDVRGCIQVNAPNVTIRNTRISCPDTDTPGGSYIRVRSNSTSLTIVDSEIDCQGGYGIAVGTANFYLLRVDISNCENGGHIDSNVTVRDSWIHGLGGGADGHFDGFQFGQGGSNVTIDHNTIDNPNDQTSAIIMWDEGNPQNANVLITRNLLAGGGYTLYCGKFGTALNVRVTNNRFATGHWGNSTNCATGGEVWTGNVQDSTGAAIAAA